MFCEAAVVGCGAHAPARACTAVAVESIKQLRVGGLVGALSCFGCVVCVCVLFVFCAEWCLMFVSAWRGIPVSASLSLSLLRVCLSVWVLLG